MFDLVGVNLICYERNGLTFLDQMLKAYAEVGLRYRIWGNGQINFGPTSYTYQDSALGITQLGDFSNLDLVVWCLPSKMFSLDFCLQKYLQYLRSSFVGPIIFVLTAHSVELMYESHLDKTRQIYPWGKITTQMSLGLSLDNQTRLEFEGSSYSIEEWLVIFQRHWKLKSLGL